MQQVAGKRCAAIGGNGKKHNEERTKDGQKTNKGEKEKGGGKKKGGGRDPEVTKEKKEAKKMRNKKREEMGGGQAVPSSGVKGEGHKKKIITVS